MKMYSPKLACQKSKLITCSVLHFLLTFPAHYLRHPLPDKLGPGAQLRPHPWDQIPDWPRYQPSNNAQQFLPLDFVVCGLSEFIFVIIATLAIFMFSTIIGFDEWVWLKCKYEVMVWLPLPTVEPSSTQDPGMWSEYLCAVNVTAPKFEGQLWDGSNTAWRFLFWNSPNSIWFWPPPPYLLRFLNQIWK